MSKVRRYTSYASTYGGVAQEFSSDGDSVDYDDYAEAIKALRECEDRLSSAVGYERDAAATLQRWSESGDHDATAILSARAVLERAP